MKRIIYVVEHWQVAEPDAGRQHLISQGFDVRIVEPWKREALPNLTGDEAGVMIMGGPQMISEASANSHAYLLDELKFIERVMNRDIPLMGVCLGSQMIAQAMGAKIGYDDDERMAMGFYGLDVTEAGEGMLPADLMVLNGNSQGWDVPHGATLLATSRDDNPFPNQAFIKDSTLALQFHPEVTRKILTQWQTEFGNHIGREGTRSKEEQDKGFELHDTPLKAWYKGMLEEWFGV